ncbi:MarR family winged helix-turn-helix transcriptional regulator [Actinopolymorpha singaporensis]|uniref:DNA-binding transcriptional regulator, MarR family n=1 Tax=Actinopolymorpha singaporensis TaxID=117157 RepID=A0A1H1XFE8_9ACTN|nr:MarR family transcriptional regulator [Actinopolymorpha singaporensis]SDT08023.1 DNA-binding transcriptional regulator, MarR family [Actinopolymorpha singaporensis]
MHDPARTANLLGAAALALTDRLLAGTTDAAGTSPSGAAALVVLATSPDLNVTEVGRRVGLSQPAATRMVDGLVADGLLARGPSLGRASRVRLTRRGRARARRLLGTRGEVLTDAVTALSATEQATLSALLEKLLTHLYPTVGSADLLCRLCDRAACTAADATCPVGAAARERAS